MTSDYRIVREPRGEVLRSLLAYGATRCESFLVALTDMRRDEEAERVLSALDPFRVRREETNEYPAGKLPWGTITVETYSLNPASLEIVSSATDHLYGWQEPELPNDLCFLIEGDPWLTTIASDRVAIISETRQGITALCSAIPTLRVLPLNEGAATTKHRLAL